METTTQELIYQLLILVASGVLATIGAYLKSYIKTKIDVTRYGFENDKLERIITNAVDYAEQKASCYAKKHSASLAGSQKLNYARTYINMVDQNIVKDYGDSLKLMIERRVEQHIK